METTLKCSKWLLFVFVIPMAVVLFGCRFFKKTITKQSCDSTASSEVSAKILTRETKHIAAYEYGDTLSYEGFIAASGGTVNADSKGVATTLHLTPVYDDKNGLVGFELKNKTLAKPTKKFTQEQNTITDNQQQLKHFENVRAKVTDAHIEKKGTPALWWVWPLLLLILLFIVRRWL